MKSTILFIGVIIMISACGTKPITAPYYKPMIATKSVATPHTYKAIAKKVFSQPTRKIYSLHEYSRFMFEEDCEELIFREGELLHELKNNPLDIIDVMKDVKKNLIKSHCKY